MYVARAGAIDGAYEKWNGSGWGGDPKPIITFDGGADDWGAGEPSFVVKGETLYIYYTWHYRDSTGRVVRQTRVAEADAACENWPLTIREQGVAIEYADPSCDSADVKYVEDFGKFLAVSTSQRMTEDSCVSFYASDDGLRFAKACDLKTNVAYYCHNAGLSSRPNGHIRLGDPHLIGYAYGPDWAKWCTRLQRIEIGLADAPDFSDAQNANLRTQPQYPDRQLIEPILGITDEQHVYTLHKGRPQRLHPAAVTPSRQKLPLLAGVRFSGYDPAVVRIVGGVLIPVGAGSTTVTASWRGCTVDVPVHVTGG